jgi:hypothetical protein
MAGLTYDGNSLLVFALVTVLLGGSAAALTGRAIAEAWRPLWHVLPFTLLIGAAVRFLHFALFGGALISPGYYVVDTAVSVACGLIGFRLMRVSQMVGCYGWINQRAGAFQWRRIRGPDGALESG